MALAATLFGARRGVCGCKQAGQRMEISGDSKDAIQRNRHEGIRPENTENHVGTIQKQRQLPEGSRLLRQGEEH